MRTRLPKPRPLTMPRRAHMSCTAAINGNASQAVQRARYPNCAPAIEYVPMPDGSSSEAPVTSPGPSIEMNRRSLPGLALESRRVTMRAQAMRPLYPSPEVHDETYQEEHEEQDEENLGDTGKCHSGSAETEQRRDDRDNQKYQRIIKHLRTSGC